MTVRLGIVGAGDVAQRDYLPELPRLDGRIEVTWICSRGAGRAESVAAEFGVDRWTTDYRELVSAGDVDAILNLTPFRLHREVTLAALEAGKHVYSEKPLALALADAEEIAAAARDRGLVLIPAPSVMLFPQVQYALAALESERLGDVYSARAHVLGGVPPWKGYRSDPAPFFAADTGPLVDVGIYALHALTGLLGPARRVSAASSRTRDSFVVPDGPTAGNRVTVEADDNWHLLLEFDGGRLASLQSSNCVAGSLSPQLELQGERGSMGLSLLDVSEPAQVLAGGELRVEPIEHERAKGPDHLLGVEHLVDCIEGREPTLTVTHALHVIEVLEAATVASREHRAVEIAAPSAPLSPAASR